MTMIHPKMITRTSGQFLSLGGLALALTAMVACGGKSSSPSPTISALAGSYTGTTIEGGDVYAVILPGTGASRMLQVNNAMYSGLLTWNGSTLGGTISEFLPGSPTAPSAANAVTVSGSMSSNVLNVVATDGSGNVVSQALIPDGTSMTAVPLAGMAGTYEAPANLASNGLGGAFNVAADGTVTGSDTVGTYSGSFTAVASATNTYTASFTYTPDDTTLSPVKFSGVAMYRSSSNIPWVVLMADSGATQYSGVFSLMGPTPAAEKAAQIKAKMEKK